MRVKGTKPALLSQMPNPGYFLIVRERLGRGSSLKDDLHRKAAGKNRMECMHEAEALERELNGGRTYDEAELHRIAVAREKPNGTSTAEFKQGAYFVAVFTSHQAAQFPGFEKWGKRPAAKMAPKGRAVTRSRKLAAR